MPPDAEAAAEPATAHLGSFDQRARERRRGAGTHQPALRNLSLVRPDSPVAKKAVEMPPPPARPVPRTPQHSDKGENQPPADATPLPKARGRDAAARKPDLQLPTPLRRQTPAFERLRRERESREKLAQVEFQRQLDAEAAAERAAELERLVRDTEDDVDAGLFEADIVEADIVELEPVAQPRAAAGPRRAPAPWAGFIPLDTPGANARKPRAAAAETSAATTALTRAILEQWTLDDLPVGAPAPLVVPASPESPERVQRRAAPCAPAAPLPTSPALPPSSPLLRVALAVAPAPSSPILLPVLPPVLPPAAEPLLPVNGNFNDALSDSPAKEPPVWDPAPVGDFSSVADEPMAAPPSDDWREPSSPIRAPSPVRAPKRTGPLAGRPFAPLKSVGKSAARKATAPRRQRPALSDDSDDSSSLDESGGDSSDSEYVSSESDSDARRRRRPLEKHSGRKRAAGGPSSRRSRPAAAPARARKPSSRPGRSHGRPRRRSADSSGSDSDLDAVYVRRRRRDASAESSESESSDSSRGDFVSPKTRAGYRSRGLAPAIEREYGGRTIVRIRRVR